MCSQYTSRQDIWDLLYTDKPLELNGTTPASQAFTCRGPRGEVCRPGWVNVRHHLGLKPLEVAEFRCDRRDISRNTSCEQPIRPFYHSLHEALLACESLPGTCSGVQFDAINRFNLWQDRSSLTDGISLGDFELGYMRSSRRMLDVQSEASTPVVISMPRVLPLTAGTELSHGRALQVEAAPSPPGLDEPKGAAAAATIDGGRVEITYSRARTQRALLQGGGSNILEPEALARIQSVEQRLQELPDFDRFATTFISIAPCFQYNTTTMSGLKLDSMCDLTGSKFRDLISSDLAFSPNASCSALKTRIDFEYPSGGPGSFVTSVVRFLEKSNDDVIAVAFDGGKPSFKQTAVMTAVMDDVFLIIPSIAAVFVICATVLLRLRFAVAALMIVLLAIPVSRAVVCL